MKKQFPMKYWYLASQYSKHPLGLDAAHREVCRAAAELIAARIVVYSPIAHSHPISEIGGLDKLDHDLWLPQCFPLLDLAEGVIVLASPGWNESVGIAAELRRAADWGMPIVYWHPGTPIPEELLP